MSQLRFGLLTIVTVVCTAVVPLNAQNSPTPQPAVRLPGFGAFMVMLVQPQHIKLGLAGKLRNWALAGHALKELGEVFDYLVAVRPVFRNQQLGAVITTMTGEARKALDQAIKAGDEKKFDEAYERLTQGCNACHASFGQSYVVIQKPDAAMYPDQDFRPRP